MTVPFGPIPFASTDNVNIAYDLELTPHTDMAMIPEKLEVIDPATGKILYTEDGALLAAMYLPASVPPPTPAELQIGTVNRTLSRIMIWVVVSPDAVPDRLIHRLTLNRSAGGLTPLTITGADIAVRKDLKPVVVGAPLKGPGWFAMETTSPMTHHFPAEIALNGSTRVSQRFAQDWIYLDPVTGQAVSGNASLARNYYGFGKEIYAVADGTVADTGNGFPDSEGIFTPLGLTVETAAGNYVILDIGNNKYACYAHMVNGSVRVKKGDTVKEGQVIGLMGNSGNSDLPHLHFQVVTDYPSFLGADGYPHVYRSFNISGGINLTLAEERFADPSKTREQIWSGFGELISFARQPVLQAERVPENVMVVTFP